MNLFVAILHVKDIICECVFEWVCTCQVVCYVSLKTAKKCITVWFSMYSKTPLIRPPLESHWCGRIRGMVALEGFVYEQKPLSVTRIVDLWSYERDGRW